MKPEKRIISLRSCPIGWLRTGDRGETLCTSSCAWARVTSSGNIVCALVTP